MVRRYVLDKADLIKAVEYWIVHKHGVPIESDIKVEIEVGMDTIGYGPGERQVPCLGDVTVDVKEKA